MLSLARVSLVALVGCHAQTPAEPTGIVECSLERTFARAPRASGHADLSHLRVGHNAFALGRVGKFGEHFAIYFHSLEDNVCRLRATDARDAEIEWCAWGGLAQPPKEFPPLAPDVAPLAHALVERAAAGCSGDRGMKARAFGAYRSLVIYEVIPKGDGRGAVGTLELGADATLSRVVSVQMSMSSSYGALDVPSDVEWLDVPFDDGETLVTKLIADARSVEDAGAPARALASAALEAARHS